MSLYQYLPKPLERRNPAEIPQFSLVEQALDFSIPIFQHREDERRCCEAEARTLLRALKETG